MRDLLLGSPGRPSSLVLAARLALLGLLVVWGWRLASPPLDPAIADSFLHLVNLPFHEAGHVLFSPFGELLTALGGSLMQLIVPAICAGALLVQARDPFGASVCTWWFGENLLDLAPYIADARALQLALLGGRTGAEVEGHDWEYVLSSLGWLHLDQTLGAAAQRAGVLIMAGAVAWGGLVLVRQMRGTRS